MMFELRRGRRAVGEEPGEARAEMMFELRRGPIFELSGGLWPSRGEAGLIPQAWHFELKGEALRRGLSGSAVRRGLNK